MASKTYPVPPSDKGVAPLLVAGGVSPTPLVHAPQYGATQALPPTPVPRLLHTAVSPAIIRPPNNRFFRPAQPLMATPSVLYAWPQTPTTPGGAVPSLFGTDPKPGVGRPTKGGSSPPQAPPYAAIGTTVAAVPPVPTSSATNAPVAEARITALRNALELRKSKALTPYKVEAWNSMLLQCNLYVKYPSLVNSLLDGFDAGIRPIYVTSTPPNSPTLLLHPVAYQEMVSNEFNKGRYIGPCTRQEVEALIGPFQSSPLSWVPKPGKYRAVHNFSHPHSPNPPICSINSSIDADSYPCTWGTFATVCHTVFNLPEGSQAAIRDVAEAYRTIPILPDQWPGLVVRLVDDNQFAINVCNNFGLTSAGGIYGLLSDATLDIFRAQGIGPISKWVDDHIFFRIPVQHLASYNASRRRWHATIMRNGDRHQTGSRFWYQGENMPDDLPAEFDENAAHPFQSFSHLPDRSPFDSMFTYSDVDIDGISGQLGIPWEPSKTIPFSYMVPYLGFEWNLSNRTVALPERKKAKYKAAIEKWLLRPTHNLDEAQKLYGKLLHACLVLPAGRAYLTCLEGLMASFSSNPFVPHHAPCHASSDLAWWLDALSSPAVSHPIPGPAVVTDRLAFSDASSGIGVAIVIHGFWRAWSLLPGW